MAEPQSPDDFKMSLFDHLAELRTRLFRITIAVLILGGLSLFFSREIYGFLMAPVLKALPPGASSLVYTSAIEEINVLMKIGLYAGVFASTPVVLWQIWGFVAPALYDSEKKFAGPFIFSGTVAFIGGAAFCYFVLLPQMFQFLLQHEDTQAIRDRVTLARLREQDAMRLLSLGDVSRASAHAKLALTDLEAPGEGAVPGAVARQSVDTTGRVEGLGRLIDATRDGLGEQSRAVLIAVVEKHIEAAAALAEGKLASADALCDEAAARLATVAPQRTEDFSVLWKLERLLGHAHASIESSEWTRPMLSMSEQLTLVLVLEVAFGFIFELPLVMMILGILGIVKSSFLLKYQRHAFVVCLIAAALITPTGDAINLALMAGPMLLCYELGILLVWIVERRRPPAPANS